MQSQWFSLVTSFLISLLAVGCGPHNAPSKLESAQEPHRPRSGPWFEGWYARVSDRDGQRSVAVIVGMNVPPGTSPSKDAKYPGYIGILLSDGNGQPTRSWTFLPKDTTTTVNGQPVTQDPAIWRRDDAPFRFDAPGYGFVTNDSLEVTVPGQIAVKMQFGAPKPWNTRGLPLGPESVIAALPVPLHWFVKSLNSPARFAVKTWDSSGNETDSSGEGSAHLEKNWGQVFPKAWNWLQATAADDAQIVMGGGTVGILGRDLKAWLGGYRSATESWDLRFSDPGTKIEVDEEYCTGRFVLKASRRDLAIEIAATAPPATFGGVAVPTKDGFVADFGAESFSSTIEVKTFRPSAGSLKLTDRRVFSNGALEFGAGSYRKDCSRGSGKSS